MDLLFKRHQWSRATGKATFRLWAKIEMDEDEQEIVKRYRFDRVVLIEVTQPTLIRQCAIVAVFVFVVVCVGLVTRMAVGHAMLVSMVAGGGAAFWYFNENRETIFVKDLIHGRYFVCDSVVDLARKEAWLGTVTSFLRQVMESAIHWDGTETHRVEALPKDEARQVIIKGI